MLAVVLGANVGITISVQLLAFRLQEYSGVFLVSGGIGFLFLKRPIFRGAGQMLLGIGLVFLAMGIIGSAGATAAKNDDLKLDCFHSHLHNLPVPSGMGTCQRPISPR